MRTEMIDSHCMIDTIRTASEVIELGMNWDYQKWIAKVLLEIFLIIVILIVMNKNTFWCKTCNDTIGPDTVPSVEPEL